LLECQTSSYAYVVESAAVAGCNLPRQRADDDGWISIWSRQDCWRKWHSLGYNTPSDPHVEPELLLAFTTLWVALWIGLQARPY